MKFLLRDKQHGYSLASMSTHVFPRVFGVSSLSVLVAARSKLPLRMKRTLFGIDTILELPSR